MLVVDITLKEAHDAFCRKAYDESSGSYKLVLDLLKKLPESEIQSHLERVKYVRKQSYENYAESLLEVGRTQEALNTLSEYCSVEPGNPDAFVRLGTALRKSGLVDAAIDALEAALRLNPTHSKAKVTLNAAKIDKKMPTTPRAGATATAAAGLVAPVLPQIDSSVKTLVQGLAGGGAGRESMTAPQPFSLSSRPLSTAVAVAATAPSISSTAVTRDEEQRRSSCIGAVDVVPQDVAAARHVESAKEVNGAGIVRDLPPPTPPALVAQPMTSAGSDSSSSPRGIMAAADQAGLSVQTSSSTTHQQMKQAPNAVGSKRPLSVREQQAPSAVAPRPSLAPNNSDSQLSSSFSSSSEVGTSVKNEPAAQLAPLSPVAPVVAVVQSPLDAAIRRFPTLYLLCALGLLVVLHNVMEGPSKPVRRIVGLPLSAFTSVVVLLLSLKFMLWLDMSPPAAAAAAEKVVQPPSIGGAK